MGDFDLFAYIGIAAFIGYAFYRQLTSYKEYKKELDNLLENHHDLKVSYYILSRIFFLTVLIAAVIYFIFFSKDESRFIASLLMFILGLNEIVAIFMFGRLFSNKDLFFFNGKTVRYRSIKEIIKKKNPLVAEVSLVNNEKISIPRGATKLIESGLEEYQKSRQKRK